MSKDYFHTYAKHCSAPPPPGAGAKILADSESFAFFKTPAIMLACAAVAQLDRVLGYEPRGRGFNSCQPHQNTVVNKGLRSRELLSPFSLRAAISSLEPGLKKIYRFLLSILCRLGKSCHNLVFRGCSSAG
jgi:hypothetical protein